MPFCPRRSWRRIGVLCQYHDSMSSGQDDESTSTLRAQLAQASDDRERAGLHDAIAVRLAREGCLEEALAENTRAVELRDALARSDPGVLPFLAVSLGNYGGHLSALERFEEATAAHLRALEILERSDPSAPLPLARLAYNASRLGLILFELKQPALAARFDGMSFAFYQHLAETNPRYAEPASGQLNALCLSIDSAAEAPPAEAHPTTLDVERLSAAGKASFRTASYLSQWGEAMFQEGDLALAVVLARRTVVYCDLFRGDSGRDSLTSLRRESRRRATHWSGALRLSGVRTQVRREPDRRLWSITGQQLSGFIAELVQRGFPSSDVYRLGASFARSGLYPARDCEYRCLSQLPQVFITYTWSDNYVDLQVAVRSALTYLGGLIRRGATGTR